NDPNPLFKKWLGEWLKYSEENNLGNKTALARALNSFEKYPLPLASARECIILEGFGPTICEMLDKKHKKYKNEEMKCSGNVEVPAEKKKVSKKPKAGTSSSKTSPKKRATKKIVPETKSEQKEDANIVVMSPSTFQIILLVDTQETKGKTKKALDATICELNASKVIYEVRHLSVGDFAWIARDPEGNELVLPYIVERKRLDDFGSSIRDGRFHEQKFRLMRSGIPNVIYMVEMYDSRHLGLPFKTIMQAATNTNVHNKFTVKITDNHHGSILYLSVMSKMLEKIFEEKILVGCSKVDIKEFKMTDDFVSLMHFKEFNASSSKTREMKVRDFFARQLIQLSSMSVDKALAITRIYGTPRILMNAYRMRNEQEGRDLLTNIKYGRLGRQIGHKLSEIIYEFYYNTLTY
uniref:Crossover junction endonuclease MUS81 n=1 Tax=Phlebotomus papatasi TaxID=29031 RepID=A0A1B0DLB8_PHLPP